MEKITETKNVTVNSISAEGELHKREIIEIVMNTEDEWILQQIHKFVVNMTE